MLRNYKSSLKRLALYFETSKNNWRARAKIYQEEKRQQQTQIRDLKRSKSNWKCKCLELKKELDAIKKQQKVKKKPRQ